MGLEVETKFLEAVEMGDFNAEKDTPEYELMGQEIFQNSTDLNRLKTLTMPTGGNAMRLTKEVNN
jgi:endonuclease/exonuclease/phosphatase family metal-dependent hydrolase